MPDPACPIATLSSMAAHLSPTIFNALRISNLSAFSKLMFPLAATLHIQARKHYFNQTNQILGCLVVYCSPLSA